MAAWYTLRINMQSIGMVEIRRVSPQIPVPDADTLCTYDVRRDGDMVGQVEHRYGDDVCVLNALAANLIARKTTDWAERCTCGHDGLDAMFHLRPCPVAELRVMAGRLGYHLSRLDDWEAV